MKTPHLQICLLGSGEGPKLLWVALGGPSQERKDVVGPAGHTFSGCSPGRHGQDSAGGVAAPAQGEARSPGRGAAGSPTTPCEDEHHGRPKTCIPQSWASQGQTDGSFVPRTLFTVLRFPHE